MAEQKIYVGKGKKQGQFNQLRLNICLSDIPKEHMTEFKGKKYVNLDISEMRNADDKGNTHTVTVNTWKPEQKQQSKPQVKEESTDDLPF